MKGDNIMITELILALLKMLVPMALTTIITMGVVIIGYYPHYKKTHEGLFPFLIKKIMGK